MFNLFARIDPRFVPLVAAIGVVAPITVALGSDNDNESQSKFLAQSSSSGTDEIDSGTSADSSESAFVSGGDGNDLSTGSIAIDGYYAIAAGGCIADLDFDFNVDGQDLKILLSSWGFADSAADLDGDGLVSASDLALLVSYWGSCIDALEEDESADASEPVAR